MMVSSSSISHVWHIFMYEEFDVSVKSFILIQNMYVFIFQPFVVVQTFS